jgi:hypothetical protein
MKREIAFYIARCDICQRVKAEHQRPAGLLQPLKVPIWKWEEVGMDFITGLPTSRDKTLFGSLWTASPSCPFYSSQDHRPWEPSGRTVHLAHSQPSWHPQDHSIRPRSSVYLSILGKAPGSLRHQAIFQHSLPPANWRLDGTSKSNPQRHVACLCSVLWNQVGGLFVIR